MKYTYENKVFNLNVVDDGTLDTVIMVNGNEYRFDSDGRNTDGSIPETMFVDAIEAYLEDKAMGVI